VTVLLSSHILAEVQQVCDAATIIGHGRMLASGRVDDLIGASTTYRVGVPDPTAAAALLSAAGHPARVEGTGLVVDTPASPAEITRTLVGGGIYLTELVAVRADLESVFLQLTEQATLGHGPDEGVRA
jgi:ABC-2 type transport system ATP-binding protein